MPFSPPFLLRESQERRPDPAPDSGMNTTVNHGGSAQGVQATRSRQAQYHLLMLSGLTCRQAQTVCYQSCG